MKNKKVLIVDDDSTTRTLLRDILEPMHYAVLDAENGQKAYELIQKESIDLLITDRSMPVLGGLELLQRLREEKNNMPVLIISAFGEERLWAEAIGLGAEDYILKPFTSEEVLKVVQKHLS